MKHTAAILTAEELGQIRNVDRFLPSQDVMPKKFNGTQSEFFGSEEAQ